MARYANHTCERCGYKTHRLFDIVDWGRFGICGDCALDIVREEEDEDQKLAILEQLEEQEDED